MEEHKAIKVFVRQIGNVGRKKSKFAFPGDETVGRRSQEV